MNPLLFILVLSISAVMALSSFYWNDEAWAINLTFLSWDSFFAFFNTSGDYHPFLYFSLLKLFSHSEFVSIGYYKIINLFINFMFFCLLLFVSYKQKRNVFFYFLLLLFFLNPVSIYMIDELRQYSVALFLVGTIILLTDQLLNDYGYANNILIFLSILISLLAITNYASALAIFVIMANLLLRLFIEKKYIKIFLVLSFPLFIFLLFHNMILGHIVKELHYKKSLTDTAHFIFITSLTTIGTYLFTLITIPKKILFIKNTFFQSLLFCVVILIAIYFGLLFNFLNIGNTYVMCFSLYLLLILNIKDINKAMILALLTIAIAGFFYNLRILYHPKYIEPNRVSPTRHINQTMCNSDFVIIEWAGTGELYGKIINQICFNDPRIEYYDYSDSVDLSDRHGVYILTRIYRNTLGGIPVSDGLYYKR